MWDGVEQDSLGWLEGWLSLLGAVPRQLGMPACVARNAVV